MAAPQGEKRNLEVDEEMQSKKLRISERESPLSEENDEIWCEMLDSDEKVIVENEMNDDHEVVEMEQLVQRAAGKGNARGANVHEKSLKGSQRDRMEETPRKESSAHFVR